jgi:hypothetical protein
MLKTPSVFSNKVLSLAAKDLHDNKDRSKVWSLAGSGWRTVLEHHKTNMFSQFIGVLNSPRSKNIDAMFTTLIGMPKISSHWQWKGTTSVKVVAKLDSLVSLRNEIAHTVKASRKIRKKFNYDMALFLLRLGVVSSNRVRSYLKSRTGKDPWMQMYYGKTI